MIDTIAKPTISIAERINDHNNHDSEPDRFIGMANDVIQGIKEGTLFDVPIQHPSRATSRKTRSTVIKLSTEDVKIALAKHMNEVYDHSVSCASDPLRIISIYQADSKTIAAAMVTTNRAEFNSDYCDAYVMLVSDYLRQHPGLYHDFVDYIDKLSDVPVAVKNNPVVHDDIALCMRAATVRQQDHSQSVVVR